MLSFVFMTIGGVIGWWFRGTRAGTWIKNAFSKEVKAE